MKKEIALDKSTWLLEPGCVVMVTSGNMKKANIMTFSWQTPVNLSKPPLVVLVINHVRYSYKLIKKNRELVINIPGAELLEQVHFVGGPTGKNRDKIRESGLTPVPAKFVAPPLIKECPGNLECRVVKIFKMDTHDLLVCKILRAIAESRFYKGRWLPKKFHTLHFLAGNSYGVLDREVQVKKWIGNKKLNY